MADPFGQPRQRWQIRFSRTGPALGMRQDHLMREFERAIREAGLPLSTTGERARPRLKLAANLPPGVDAHGEILEAHFDELVPTDRLLAAGELLPDGVRFVDAREVWHGFPSAASQVRAAEYEVDVRSAAPFTEQELRDALVRVLGERRLPGRRSRGETERRTDAGERDLRPLIEDVSVASVAEDGRTARLAMTLRLNAAGAGRPHDVVAALSLPLEVVGVIRRRLLFVDTPPIAR